MSRRPGSAQHASEALWLGLVLGLVAVAAGRRLPVHSAEFDEGVYLGSAVALADGASLGPEVFASQPPLFFMGLRALAMATGGDAALMRAGVLLLCLGGVLAAALVVRPLGGPLAGGVAALLVGLSPAVVDRAAVVSADVPAIALGLMALAVLAASRRPAAAAAAGALVAAAVLVKLLALPFAAAVLVGAWRGRLPRRGWAAMGAGAAAVTVAVLLPHATRLGDLWDGAVGIRGAARGVAIAPSDPDLAIVLGFAGLGLGALAAIGLAAPASWRSWADDRAALIALLTAAAAMLTVQRPLFLHHWALLSVPLAVLTASALPRGLRAPHAVALAAALVLLLPGAMRGRVVLSDEAGAQLAGVARAVAGVTPPGEVVVSDLPLVPLAARRPADASTVDASLVRVGSGALDETAVLRAAAGARTVVVGRAFTTMPGLLPALSSRFPRSRIVGGVRVLTADPAGPPTR